MVRFARVLSVVWGVGVGGGLGCGGGGGSADSGDLQFCVDETNRYRAMGQKPPVARSAELEAFAAAGTEADHTSQQPHGHFSATGGGGIAFAENTCPGWGGWFVGPEGIRAVVAECLAAFYSEGPGGGHYENMMGNYGTLGCGWYVEGTAITITQDFGQ